MLLVTASNLQMHPKWTKVKYFMQRGEHLQILVNSVAELHHFYAAPAAPAPAPTLLYSKAKFLKRTKV
jgi:hypothetical protein